MDPKERPDYQEFPKVLYRESAPGEEPETRTVKDAGQQKALGEGWFEKYDEAKGAKGRPRAKVETKKEEPEPAGSKK